MFMSVCCVFLDLSVEESDDIKECSLFNGNFGFIETAQAEKAWLCRTCFIIQPFFSSSFSIVYT